MRSRSFVSGLAIQHFSKGQMRIEMQGNHEAQQGVSSSQKVFESFKGNFGCVQNLFERAGLDEVLAWNDDDVLLVGHRNMFAFAKDIEAGAFEGSHDTLMRDLRQLGHAPTSTVLNFLRRFRSSMLSR